MSKPAKEVSVAQLVELRRAKEAELRILLKRVKQVRYEVKQYNKTIQASLDAMVLTGEEVKPSPNNFGWELESEELPETEAIFPTYKG